MFDSKPKASNQIYLLEDYDFPTSLHYNMCHKWQKHYIIKILILVPDR